VLIEFPSAASAVTCALEIQNAMVVAEPEVPEGINIGDVIVERGDIHGDGISVAPRLQWEVAIRVLGGARSCVR
jgi:class 3 adenylate cyclase